MFMQGDVVLMSGRKARDLLRVLLHHTVNRRQRLLESVLLQKKGFIGLRVTRSLLSRHQAWGTRNHFKVLVKLGASTLSSGHHRRFLYCRSCVGGKSLTRSLTKNRRALTGDIKLLRGFLASGSSMRERALGAPPLPAGPGHAVSGETSGRAGFSGVKLKRHHCYSTAFLWKGEFEEQAQ